MAWGSDGGAVSASKVVDPVLDKELDGSHADCWRELIRCCARRRLRTQQEQGADPARDVLWIEDLAEAIARQLRPDADRAIAADSDSAAKTTLIWPSDRPGRFGVDSHGESLRRVEEAVISTEATERIGECLEIGRLDSPVGIYRDQPMDGAVAFWHTIADRILEGANLLPEMEVA